MRRQVKASCYLLRSQTLEFCAIMAGRNLRGLKLPKKEESLTFTGVTNKAVLMIRLRSQAEGTSLVVQGLRLRIPIQGVWVESLVRELRSHMPLSQKTKT